MRTQGESLVTGKVSPCIHLPFTSAHMLIPSASPTCKTHWPATLLGLPLLDVFARLNSAVVAQDGNVNDPPVPIDKVVPAAPLLVGLIVLVVLVTSCFFIPIHLCQPTHFLGIMSDSNSSEKRLEEGLAHAGNNAEKNVSVAGEPAALQERREHRRKHQHHYRERLHLKRKAKVDSKLPGIMQGGTLEQSRRRLSIKNEVVAAVGEFCG